jgi:putative selenium metabolism protein SsnA
VNAVTLAGGTVVSSLEPVQLLPGDVVVEDGRVASIGAAPPGTASRDCSGCLVIPGNVCAHHHLYSSLARGMPYRLDPPRNFVDILRRVWWRLDRALDDEAVWASAVVGGAVAILNGTTTVIDHHASPNAVDGSLDLIASVLADLGVRSVLCYEVSDRDGPERADAGLEENRRFLKSEWPLSRGMVGAHASFTLSEETLGACVDLARSQGAGIHVHVAEDEADQRDAQTRFGKRVGERLAAAGTLDERALLAHCVHLDEREREAIRSAGASVVHNATSNMNNSVGHAPVRSFDQLAVGTDGVGGDMFAEAKTAYWRAREVDSSIAPSWILARMADSAGVAARVFGEPLIGRIEPGAPADLVVLAYDTPTPLSAENLADHWAFGLGARHVRDVMVGGEWSVLDRTLARVDAAGLTLRCREAAARLWERLDHVAEHPFVPAGST